MSKRDNSPRNNRPIPHICVVVFTMTERHGWIHPFLPTRLINWIYSNKAQVSYCPIYAMHPVDAARNFAVKDIFLPLEADILVMLDNDVLPPEELLDGILDMPTECDIFIPPYAVFDPHQKLPVICFGDWNGKEMIPHAGWMRAGEWKEGGAGGTGAIVMRRRVFSEGKLAYPYFKISYNVEDNGTPQSMSEDIYFTKNAKEAGYRLFTNASYVCSHFHTIDIAMINEGMTKYILEHGAGAQAFGPGPVPEEGVR